MSPQTHSTSVPSEKPVQKPAPKDARDVDTSPGLDPAALQALEDERAALATKAELQAKEEAEARKKSKVP